MPESVHKSKFTIRTIWGLAKSEELNLDDEMLHNIVWQETGKESISKLTEAEIKKVCISLIRKKESALGIQTVKGNPVTQDQRKRIFNLTKKLGWSDNPARLNGFVKSKFKIDKVEWLNAQQCSILIEMLKAMLKRNYGK